MITIMRHFVFFLCFLTTAAHAQQIVNPAGQFLSSATMSVEYSVGEPAIEALSGGQEAVTQGFIQPDFDVVCIAISHDLEQTICKGDTFYFNGLPLQIAGIYRDTFVNQFGCDSIVMLVLSTQETQGFAAVDDVAELILPDDSQELTPLDNDALPDGLSPAILSFSSALQGLVTPVDSVTFTYTLQNGAFTGLDSFTYTVCLKECLQTRCDEAIVYIAVRSDLTDDIRKLVPNAITPNGDGQNDDFDPLPILWDNGLFYPEDQVELIILNRWGEVVFQVQPYQPWEGRGLNGQPLPVATYYYNLRLHGFSGTEELKGAVQVLF